MSFDHNSGYVGYSRSVRSQAAIEDYEMPLSLITKARINEFIVDREEEYANINLEKEPVTKWKVVAKLVGPSSWHHTSNYFNKTDHYSLEDIADKMISDPVECQEAYEAYKEEKRKAKQTDISYRYAVLSVQVWGGTRNRPKLIGEETVAGIVIDGWLYCHDEHNTRYAVTRYKTSANKVIKSDYFNNYTDLVKKYPAYKNSVKVFNSLIRLKTQKK